MPKYRFICDECGKEVYKFVKASRTEMRCLLSCDGTMKRALPTLNGPADVTEVVDKYTGTTWRQDQKDILKERRDEYYWTVEVPRFVNSGTYSVETMLENGWIYFDDKKQMQINNRPPHKR
jgi:hypothetical protein